MMNARLLTGMEEERFKETPDLGPQPSLTDPNGGLPVHAGPTLEAMQGGARALAQPAAALMPTAATAQPPAAQTNSRWTPERKAFADKINQAARNYREAVDKRRTLRKDRSAYGKLRNQLEASAGHLADLKHMQDTYKDIYTPDSPATMALQKRQIEHFEKAQRLRDQLLKHAQMMSKKHGLKLGQHGGLEDEEGADEGDEEFDSMMQEGYMDALTSQPPQ